MGQQIIIPGRGEITQKDILPADLIAYYKFEETEDLKVAIDWAMNFNGKTPLTHFNQSSRQVGYLGNGLVCNKTAKDNFSINMLLDEIPSSLEISIQFYIKFLEEIKKGEHGTYTLFSKQWATGMRWYCYLISRLESVQLHNVLSYVVADENCLSIQVSGASWGDLLANGLYYKRSDILYTHSIYSDWRIFFNGTNWLIQKFTGEGEEAEWISHFKSSGVEVQGDYSVEGEGQGNVAVLGVSEVSDIIQIDNVVIIKDKWYEVDLLLKLRQGFPSSFGIYLGSYEATAITSEVIDIPINTKISPQLIGGDLSNMRFCENDTTIPYIVDGFPFPSSYRYGISAIIDEVKIFRSLTKSLPVVKSEFTLTVDIEGYGTVDIDPVKDGYGWKEKVKLTAYPDDIQTFLGWGGDLTGNENPVTIEMTKDMHIISVFSGKVAKPIFNPSGGYFSSDIYVEITCLTEGATIYYTTDGSIPDNTKTLYTDKILISENTTLKAIAYKEDYDPSEITSDNYYFSYKVTKPILTPWGDYYPESLGVDVSMEVETSDAVIHYTLNGMNPTESDPVYSSPIHISSDKTVKARGFKSGWEASDITEEYYNLETNKFYDKANFPGAGRESGIAVGVGDYGYAGLGGDRSGNVFKDFYQYNGRLNIWSRKADFPGVGRKGAFAFVIGDKIYIGGGEGQIDMYCYDTTKNIFTRKADFIGDAGVSSGFSINDIGYVIANGKLYAYNPSTNYWEEKLSGLPIPYSNTRWGQERFKCFVWNGKGYFIDNHEANYHFPVYEYNPSTNSLVEKAGVPIYKSDDATGWCWAVGLFWGGYVVDGKYYLGTIYNKVSTGEIKAIITRYNISGNNWSLIYESSEWVSYLYVEGFQIHNRGFNVLGYKWHSSEGNFYFDSWNLKNKMYVP